MTARSGDALSHVYFELRQNAVLTKMSAPEFCDSNFCPGTAARSGSLSPTEKSFRSYLHGGHEAASRNEPGQFASFAYYLPKSFHAER
jgi:hypothetical protein